MWGQGFTKTKRLKDTDNVASYLMAYLTNVPKDEIVPGTIKKGIIKGARLHFYPSGVHIYRGSRGLISHITEFYDNVSDKKEANQARQDND